MFPLPNIFLTFILKCFSPSWYVVSYFLHFNWECAEPTNVTLAAGLTLYKAVVKNKSSGSGQLGLNPGGLHLPI